MWYCHLESTWDNSDRKDDNNLNTTIAVADSNGDDFFSEEDKPDDKFTNSHSLEQVVVM